MEVTDLEILANQTKLHIHFSLSAKKLSLTQEIHPLKTPFR